jgi:hypothetical protein
MGRPLPTIESLALFVAGGRRLRAANEIAGWKRLQFAVQ